MKNLTRLQLVSLITFILLGAIVCPLVSSYHLSPPTATPSSNNATIVAGVMQTLTAQASQIPPQLSSEELAGTAIAQTLTAIPSLPVPLNKPQIIFTYVPPIGSADFLSGRVEGVDPNEYAVAIYIRVGGGWWTRPTFASPVTSIFPDGTWSAPYAVGGNDAFATAIRAYLIPIVYNPPLMSGSAILPSVLGEIAVAVTEVMRSSGDINTPTPFSPKTPTQIETLPPTPRKTFTPVASISHTPNPTQVLQSIFDEIDNQFEKALKGNIAFNKPERMKKDETSSVELILNPSLSQSALATQLVNQGGFATSTAEPSILIAPNGETVTVTTSQIEITPRMKAVLLPQDPEAFTVTEMHDNAEQVVSLVETTTWRWSVTAKKEGSQTLELVIYQLVKYDGKEFWHEVETYKANIVVEVTLGERVKSLDWKWILATLLIPLAGGLWAWWKSRNKKADVTQIKIVDEKKDTKRKKDK